MRPELSFLLPSDVIPAADGRKICSSEGNHPQYIQCARENGAAQVPMSAQRHYVHYGLRLLATSWTTYLSLIRWVSLRSCRLVTAVRMCKSCRTDDNIPASSPRLLPYDAPAMNQSRPHTCVARTNRWCRRALFQSTRHGLSGGLSGGLIRLI